MFLLNSSTATRIRSLDGRYVNVTGDTMTGALNISLASGNSLIVDTTTLVVDASNDRVGIGTAAPETSLSFEPVVYTSGVTGIKFQNSENTQDAIIQPIKIGTAGILLFLASNAYVDTAGVAQSFDDTAASAYVTISNLAGQIQFGTAATGDPTQKMVIDNAGKVGIATTTPLNRFQVATNGVAIGIDAAAQGIMANAYNDGAWKFIGTGWASYIDMNSGSVGNVQIGISSASGSAGGAITWTAPLTILASGNVGIGLSPSFRLHVSDSASGVSNVFVIDNNVASAVGSGARMLFQTNYASGDLYVAGIEGRVTDVGASTYGGALIFGTQSFNEGTITERLRIDSVGNVGLSVSAWGTSATKTLGIGNGTEPSTSPADMIQIYSVDLSAGNATLGLRTETAVVTEAVVSDRTLSVRINGTTYKICLKA